MARLKAFLSNIKIGKNKASLLKFKSNPLTVGLAAMAGAALMIPVSAAVLSSSVSQDLSGQLASLNNRLVQMQAASANVGTDTAAACVAPASAGAGVQTAQYTAPAVSGGKGGGVLPSGPTTVNKTFVKKILTGSLTATATNKNTGPDSTNKIDISNRTTVTTTNTNDVQLSSDNHQYSSSGDATVSDNTKGGNATSGDATNTNKTDISILFKN